MHLPMIGMELSSYRCKICGKLFDYMSEFSKHRVWKRIGTKVFAKCEEVEYEQIKAQTSR